MADNVDTALRAAILEWSRRGLLRLVNVIRDQKLAGQVLRRRTGTAARSVTGTVLASQDGFAVGTTLGYLIAWEHGIRAHTVRARNAQALRFTTASGQVLYRKSVNIPAQAARPSFGPAFDEESGYLERTAQELIGAALTKAIPDRTIQIIR